MLQRGAGRMGQTEANDMTQIATKQEQDDPDSFQEMAENERAEYEAWSEWVAEQMEKEEA